MSLQILFWKDWVIILKLNKLLPASNSKVLVLISNYLVGGVLMF